MRKKGIKSEKYRVRSSGTEKDGRGERERGKEKGR